MQVRLELARRNAWKQRALAKAVSSLRFATALQRFSRSTPGDYGFIRGAEFGPNRIGRPERRSLGAKSRQGFLTRKYLLGPPAYWQVAPVIEMVSTFHPGAAIASSVPNRNRSVIVCPFRFGPRLITVSM